MSNAKTVSASFVRTTLADPKRADLIVTLAKDAGVKPSEVFHNIKGRGRLHPVAEKAFKRIVRGKYVYQVGVSDNKRVTLTGPKGRKFVVDTADLRKFDGSEGKRGRVSNETKAAYLESLLSAV